MESQRMTITEAHNGGINRFTTHATRRARAARALSNAQNRPNYYSANSKGSAQETKLKMGGAPQELHAHLLKSTKNSAAAPNAADQSLGSKTTSETWALFAHADRTDYWLMSGGLLAAVVSGSSLPSINIVFANAVTALNNSQFPTTNGVDMDSLTDCALTLLGIGVWVLVSEFFTVALLTHSAARQTRVMREAVMESLVYQEMAWFDTSNPFSLSSDIGGNMVVIQEGLGRKMGQFVKHTTQVILAVTVGITRAWNVGLGIAATFPLFMISIYLFVAYISKSTNLESDEFSQAGAVAEEALTSVGTVMAFNAQQSMADRFKSFLYSGDVTYRKFSKVIATAIAFIQFASFVLFGYGLWLGGHLVANQDTVVPTMKKALPAIMVEIAGLLAIGSAAPALEALASAKAAAVYILQIEKQRSMIDCRATGRELDVIAGSITFRDVVFAYPTRPRELVLKSCSFTIPAGQRVALVGPSGGGKSTLINLIERLYDPAFGHVAIDDIDIRKLGVRWLRKQFGVVRQEPVLFATTIMENIRYGYPNATDQEVIEAAMKAHAHQFIMAFPDGYSTPIGANGSLLAAGQRQRLAIARAFVKNPAMLLLDEVAVALDAESADAVHNAFDELFKAARITTLVIAHRLETLASADVVFVVEDGKIAEQGAYETLSRDPHSRYHALFGGTDKKSEQTRLTEMNLLGTSRFRGAHGHGNGKRVGGNHGTAPSMLRPSMAQQTGFDDTIYSGRRGGRESAFIDPTEVMMSSQIGTESSFFFVKDSIASNRPSDMAWLEAGGHHRSTVGYPAGKSPYPEHEVAFHEVANQDHGGAVAAPATASARGDQSGIVKKILKLMAVDKKFLVLAMMASLLNGIVNPLTAILKSNIVNELYAVEADRDYVGMRRIADKYLFMFLGVGALLGLSYFTQSYNFRLLGRNITNRMRSMTFTSMLKQDMKWFDAPGHSAGALSAMLSNDTAAVKIIAGEIQGRKIQNIVVIVFATILAFIVGSWQATLVFLAAIPFIIATIMIDQRTSWYTEEEGDRSLATAGRIANEIIHNVQTITENNLQETVLVEYRKSLDLPTRVTIKTGYSTGFALGFSQFIKWVAYAALHYFSAFFIRNGSTTFALFYRTMNLMNVAALCIDETATFIGDEKTAKIAAGRIFTLIENKPDVDVDALGEKLGDQFSGAIDISSAEFAYPLNPDAHVLTNYNLSVTGGKTTVLMGGSDAGKSTLMQLLLRLYDVTDGNIEIGGTPIQRLDVRWLRSKVAFVSQDPMLFRMSVLENIRLGRPNATLDEVIRVCEMVDADAFVQEFPDGYETLVDTEKFSRGQKQRIAIARALILNPRILLLDDATSALDKDSRARVNETLVNWEMTQGGTILAVTEDMEIVERANSIAVAEKGTVIENGTHEELLRIRGGVYATTNKRKSGLDPMTEL
ncbi:Atp-binding protein, partial [Globisporangium splendens]